MNPMLSVFAASVLGTATASIPIFPEEVEYEPGCYTLAHQRIKFFAFMFRGELTMAAVNRQTTVVVNELLKADLSAMHQRVPSTGYPSQHGIRLRTGHVLVLGWVNRSSGQVGWLATDTDGRLRPRHRWLTSDAETGMLDSRKIWSEPALASIRQCWRLLPNRSLYLISRIDAKMGVLEWSLDWQER